MNRKITKSIVLLAILISTFNCASATRNEAASDAVKTATGDSLASAETIESSAANSGGAAQKATPDALVRDLYKTHEKDSGAILDGKSRRLIDKYFDKTLADFFWKDLTTQRDEVGVLDFDPFYNAQETQIKNLRVGEPQIEGDKASVVVTFENFDRKENLTYSLARQNSAWKISDIKYTNGESLVGYFKEYEKNNAGGGNVSSTQDGNFEGTYKVGDTTCTVKPVKMAYEIKWAKGSGTMMFFSDNNPAYENSFVSDDKGKGRDRFVFDDDRLTTGKFIRADGKQMPVSKVK